MDCCAECGKNEGISLKACMSCRLVKYCNVKCQRNHWKKHKKKCQLRAAELHDEALFKDPPAKEDCPICDDDNDNDDDCITVDNYEQVGGVQQKYNNDGAGPPDEGTAVVSIQRQRRLDRMSVRRQTTNNK